MNRKSKMKVLGTSGLIVLVIIASIGFVVGRSVSNSPTLNLVNTSNEPFSQKLIQLRKLLNENSIHAYLIPSNDAHQSEYVGESDRRLTFITEFTGSAGFAIVALNEAALWVDSRYHLQAERQVDQSQWTIMKQGIPGVQTRAEWLLAVLENNSKVGFDPLLLSSTEIATLNGSLVEKGYSVIPIEKNLIDVVWDVNKPQPNITPLNVHPLEYSGKKIIDKINAINDELQKLNADSVFLTALDDIAWLFNLRASDISYTPVFYSYALISRNHGIQLFLHKNRITSQIQQHFENEGIKDLIQVKDYEQIVTSLKDYVELSSEKIVIPTSVNFAISSVVPTSRTIRKNLVSIMKSVKNDIEAEGMKQAHIRDGAAIVRYLHWLEQNVDVLNITELSGADKLKVFRSEQDKYQSLSFTSISAVGSNAAMAHYTPDEETNKQITRNEIYLIDSGGQYLDGTSDTTRTIHLGQPNEMEKECFTRVFKGFIAVFTSVFPSGATETFFDAMARRYLWEVGLDYGHGTGHGVGSYLGVHEYPPLFSSRSDASNPGILRNMFTSNEPGIYIDGKFGVRIEDVIQAVSANTRFDFSGKGALKYDIVTLVPFQKKLLDLNLLTNDEITWINEYHAKVLKEVGDLLLKQGHNATYEWLKIETEPIRR
uniref:CSON009826 protein n=1 Tax=Culicoides sonorensis TaxID=179676 RepID=A0A336M0S0_CULSO